ncbi:MAG TPA: 16S rRNA (cytidine(1402)-2'-O)-methyltransferase [Gammaproteobacteria bacterium]|nr:16S rRNA (cytidine(1402)-2'-O)-methyltransferase [Xanthomonadales bacterium]HOP21652.1 16S rRNA (cytidine(1402)-2'-O)-methyltransferase [Gammaproteobacteria bacterium]
MIKDIGTLYIVATPIGNLDDITKRAISILSEVDIIACEDTRHTGRLLANYGIKNKLVSFHQHNENQFAESLINLLNKNNNIALVSDAGTPLISDPGYPLVKLAHENHIKVVPVVGASAIIALLCSSGLPTNEFLFTGFLPAKSKQREEELKRICENPFTTVIYESTHRIIKSLEDMEKILGKDRIIVIGRELTKTFETIKLGKVSEILDFVQSDSNQTKGEFVIAISALEVEKTEDISEQQKQLAQLLSKELPPKKAAKITAEFLNGNSKNIYNFLIK